jgi:clan AA aspartic protease (TIGR02281 family)
MHKLTYVLLILGTGGFLGWYAHDRWGADPVQSASPVDLVPLQSDITEKSTAGFIPPEPDRVDNITQLLKRNAFQAALEHYETLQDQASDEAVERARIQILSHARRLIADQRFSSAEQLLQLFLIAAYRDVEARALLAEAYYGHKDSRAAIDQLYESRGYAYRPDTLERITWRIRSIVTEQTESLKRSNNHSGLLALYQHLTQLEPDHAPYFIELAAVQLAFDDREAARRSLLLVSQDPDVGSHAQAMLTELHLTVAGMQEAEPPVPLTEVAGIPLHRSGHHFLVDARPNNARSIRLLIDTGASLTILTPDTLERLGIHYTNTGRTNVFTTANGLVRAPVYTLDALSVGDWQVSRLEIGVLDLGGGSGIDGLLGMNFLLHFQFYIDQNDALLRLSIN